jgi:hypothetical protein
MASVVKASAGVYIEVEDRSRVASHQKQVSKGVVVLLSNQGPVDQIVKITNGPNQFLSLFGTPDASLGFGHQTVLTALLYMQEILITRVHHRARFGGISVTKGSGGMGFKQWATPKDVDAYDPNMFYLDSADTDFSLTNTLKQQTDAGGVPMVDAGGHPIMIPDKYADFFYIYGADPNKYNGNYRVAVANIKDSTDKSNPNTFQILVYSKNSAANSRPVETWTVSRDQQVDGYGRQQFLETVINGKSKYIRVANNALNTDKIVPSLIPSDNILLYLPPVGTDPASLAYLSNGESGTTMEDGSPISMTDLPIIYNGTDAFPSQIANPPTPVKNSGLQLYYEREEVKFDLLINAGITFPSVQKRMLDIAIKRGDCFVILDMPFDKQGNRFDPTTDAVDYRDNKYGGLAVDTPYGAIYTPWIDIVDNFTGKVNTVPPSGHVAAVYCATDTNWATWFAPAGLKRALLDAIDPNFVGTKMIYHQNSRDIFEVNQINCTRVFENLGTALWGATTLQRMESAMSNVNVVRLILFLSRNIDTQLMYNVFDPNDAYLRAEIVQRLNDILEPIKLGRGLYNYNVVCAGPGEPNANNTYDDIALGDLNVDVYLEPTIPAKRINVKLIVNKAGVSLGSATTLG